MSKRAHFDMPAMRRREIERFARAIDVADTDDFRRFLVAWAWHNPKSKDAVGALMMVAKRMGRDISEAEADATLDEAGATPKHRTADALGRFLRLTEPLRIALRIRTIGSIDVTKRQRARRRKEQRRAREQARRERQGSKTRSEYLASHATSRLKPWQALGISRRTWYRRLAVAQVHGQSPLPHVAQVHGQSSYLKQARTCANGEAVKRAVRGQHLPKGRSETTAHKVVARTGRHTDGTESISLERHMRARVPCGLREGLQ